jgi:MFS family permease
MANNPRFGALAKLSRDGRLLFATLMIRLFGYGLLTVVLVLYLVSAGLTNRQVGVLLTLTLVGDTAISLWITTNADRIGRKKMLILGAALMVVAGLVFIATKNFALLLVAATFGVISPSGSEVGPFLAIEQASLSGTLEATDRTAIFGCYNLVGSLATALGALAGGWGAEILEASGRSALDSYKIVIAIYALLGLVLMGFFACLSQSVEVDPLLLPKTSRLGLHKSRKVVLRLSGLFALDAFAGGLVLQSIVSYWFVIRFHAQPAVLGDMFFGANLLAGISALLAARLAARFGLINTMVFTHLPSNVLLMLVPLMPNLGSAIAVLFARFAISQMDVPARQSYVMHVVDPDERSAAAGVTGVARTVGSAISPAIALPLLGSAALIGVPFFLAGGLKIVYDLLLYGGFKAQAREGSA